VTLTGGNEQFESGFQITMKRSADHDGSLTAGRTVASSHIFSQLVVSSIGWISFCQSLKLFVVISQKSMNTCVHECTWILKYKVGDDLPNGINCSQLLG
jgi:hypothetical protein